MAGETTITIIGNLTDAPDLRYAKGSGVAIARFTVASTARTFDKASGGWRDGDPLFLTCTAWRDLAEHASESLTKGARVIVTGRLRLSRWETPDGQKRSMVQLDVDEVGPSLRFATATVKKLTRTTGGIDTPQADDPWSTATATRDTAPATGDGDPFTADGGGFSDDEPPF
ncbi:single-stranded DNA-binding protein [Virgisporangium aurantiacum]|uniref:Single-stranded DNA-binding protein n=1 Tax=Virgisporangium aurantiacum TaxID=175570 RepID=A0A8J3YYW8_9ACTN|nr:single-stranded DNA-binding protein [Virgisporangium aurantiacum]GIJ53222.1 single-stranded DNA-binding protein [Virgisporangium aurantiacum]